MGNLRITLFFSTSPLIYAVYSICIVCESGHSHITAHKFVALAISFSSCMIICLMLLVVRPCIHVTSVKSAASQHVYRNMNVWKYKIPVYVLYYGCYGLQTVLCALKLSAQLFNWPVIVLNISVQRFALGSLQSSASGTLKARLMRKRIKAAAIYWENKSSQNSFAAQWLAICCFICTLWSQRLPP